MKRKNGNVESTLRRRAEAKLAAEGERFAGMAERDPVALIHELEVHQIELEMQNEELRDTQQEAEEQRRRYQDLYDFAPVGYLTLDAAGKVTQANLATASLLGCERQRLVGQPLFFFLAPDSRGDYDSLLRRLLAGESGARCEVRLGANAKRQGWLLLDGGTFVAGEARQPGRVALMDISERKMAEAALLKSEEKFSRIFHTAPIMIGISTLTEGRFVDVNTAGLEILGYRRDEIIGRTALELGLWADPADRPRMVRILEEQGTVRNFEVRFREKSGRTHIGLYSADLIGLDGERYLLSVVRDITERKQAEERIEHLNTELAARAAELGAANQELEAFSYSVSHDLRIPLTSIGGYCQIIQEVCGDRLDEQCRGYLREIDEGVHRMSGLIETLLNFSRLSQVEPQRETVDLSAMANAVAVELRLTKPERRVDIRIADGVTVDGDPKLLHVVLENLLGNAWKYTYDKEEAVIEFGTADIHGKPACFVRDNGAGFDMANADKLFMPFQRLPGADAFKGHGIGLAIVQRIIQRHGGKIWAEGAPGNGATFWFTLPTSSV
jgi:PAS domain S-box-containing protein